MERAFFDDYRNVLARRFSEESFKNNELSEDCIRYDFFDIYIKHFNLTSTDLILEYPFRHASERFRTDDNFSKKNLDCVSKNKKSCFEFKFFRVANDANYNYDVTANGALTINDIYRLHYSDTFPNKYFIFVTQQNMITHLNQNDYNFGIGKSDTNKLTISKELLSKKIKSPTFSNQFDFSEKLLCDINIEKIYDEKIVGEEPTKESNKNNTYYFRLVVFKLT